MVDKHIGMPDNTPMICIECNEDKPRAAYDKCHACYRRALRGGGKSAYKTPNPIVHRKNYIEVHCFKINGESSGFFIVDKFDLNKIKKHKWRICKGRNQYVTTTIRNSSGRKNVLLHRYLTNPPDNLVVDHINWNTLDNRRCNLRHITSGENSRHRKPKS